MDTQLRFDLSQTDQTYSLMTNNFQANFKIDPPSFKLIFRIFLASNRFVLCFLLKLIVFNHKYLHPEKYFERYNPEILRNKIVL